MASPPSLTSGVFAGRYAIEKEIGRGASAVVYLARDTERGRSVAIKILRPEFAESLGADRFLREIRVTQGLQHPHILQVLDSGQAEGRLYFTLPYMEGGSLRDLLKREVQLPIEDAIDIARTVAEALDHAHRAGLIHRDVKPENILFTSGQACLADFGIARAIERATGDSTTSTGMVRGTPAYMSPEQASGSQNYDGRSDVYSLGCVLYEMISGMPAFDGPTPNAVIAQRFTHTPRDIDAYRPSTPEPIKAVIRKALALLPADRFKTAGEFAEALRKAELHTDSGLSRVRPRWSRRSIPVASAAAFAFAVALYASWDRIRDVFGSDDSRLDQDRVAIAPFNVLEPADSLWRDGLVDVLSRNLDGAGPLRSVPPTSVFKGWQGRADIPASTALGRRTGAGLVIFGHLMRAGRDTIRVTASLMDLRRGKTFEIEVRDDATRMDRITDSLTVRALRELAETRPIAAVPRATFGTRSLTALKVFLQGEQWYRANKLPEARDAYERSIQLDSTFAMAYRRMRGVLRALGPASESDSISFWYARRAGDLNRGLSLRDSLLIVADSLMTTIPRGGFFDSATVSRLRRRLSTIDEAVRRYPDDPESWFELGEARYHWGERLGITQEATLQAFDRCIVLDPHFGPAYYHAIELTEVLRDAAAAERLARNYLSFNPGDARFVIAALMLREEGSWRVALARHIDTMPAGRIIDGLVMLRRWPDTAATISDALRMVMERAGRRDATDSVRAQYWMAATALYRGRLRSARDMMTPELRSDSPIILVQLASFGLVHRDSANALFRSWLSSSDIRLASLATTWWGERRDTAALRAALVRFETATKADSVQVSLYGMVGARRARAYLALARHDSASALAQLDSLPDDACSWHCAPERFLRATLMAALTSPARAARLLDDHPPGAGQTNIYEPQWAYERARLAERLGDDSTATALYRYVRAVWTGADPELQPAVHRAREYLSRHRRP